MTIYVTNEAQLEIPEDWGDLSIIQFGSPGPLPRVGLVITKQALVAGQSAQDAVEHHMRSTSQKLRRFQLLERQTRTVGGIKGWDTSFTFSHDGLSLYQRQVVVPWGALLWALTVSGPEARRPEADQVLESAVQSIKFRRPGG